MEKLKTGVVSIFPEAGRNRHPELSQLRQFGRGAAVLAYKTHAIVVPVAMRGPENILPIGHGPRIFKKMVIVIGPSLDLTGFYQIAREKEAQRQILAVMRNELQSLLDQATQKFSRQ